jgi:hypothetical protein
MFADSVFYMLFQKMALWFNYLLNITTQVEQQMKELLARPSYGVLHLASSFRVL